MYKGLEPPLIGHISQEKHLSVEALEVHIAAAVDKRDFALLVCMLLKPSKRTRRSGLLLSARLCDDLAVTPTMQSEKSGAEYAY